MASNRDIFSKHMPNLANKLATRYDAEGREVQVERREDLDATAKEQQTFDMLVAAGYYRARIKGLSSFDKVVGGMTWCIECCDYDVDVDLLFHENLTIGQKISLVEKIVSVLPQMKCPFRIEPHQIQGLEFLSIHPVIQWLVKKSVENRTERAQRLKKFAIGQFHNNYQFKTDKENLAKIRNASIHIKRIQELYNPCRQYQRKDAPSEDERMRVRMTLLEYGHKFIASDGSKGTSLSLSGSQENEADAAAFGEDFDVEKLLKKLYINREEPTVCSTSTRLDAEQRHAMQQHYKEFKQEMEIDAKELSEQSQIKTLENTKLAMEKKLRIHREENAELGLELEKCRQKLLEQRQHKAQLDEKMAEFVATEEKADPNLLAKVKELMQLHDQLKKEETEFKEHCRQDLANLQKELDELEAFNAQNPEEQAAAIAKEKARIQDLKLQIAKKNRGIVAIQRQLDAIPDRTELTQYQRRFHELYNEMSAKHLETKQYYTLYNTLNDKKCYMEKELSLLNSICEAYSEGVMSPHGREEFIQQFEAILLGVCQTEDKVRRKHNEERARRDALNEELQNLLELQRQYAAMVKQLTLECQRCEQLQTELKALQQKGS